MNIKAENFRKGFQIIYLIILCEQICMIFIFWHELTEANMQQTLIFIQTPIIDYAFIIIF